LSDAGRKKARRAYLPTVEALEALRLFSGAAPALPEVAAEHDFFPVAPVEPIAFPPQGEAWDAALGQSRLADLLGPVSADVDAEAVLSGLSQLDRYLNRAWYRAGIPPQQHDDCTQAVYAILLANFGRGGFDSLVSDVGHSGIPAVLSRDTTDGPDFFRAVDTVKKRAQRERSFQPLDGAEVAATAGNDGLGRDWRDTLETAIVQTLSPREAALIHATLNGETPAEIAQQWGVAPKTVSNEKTRAFQKLRDFLVADLSD
jgi:hypothetical protein